MITTRDLYWIIAILVCAIGVVSIAHAHDDGRYAQSELKSWFNSLTNQHKVPCCDVADGFRISDVDWDIKDQHYRVRLDGKWIDVPTEAVVTSPNRVGSAIVWPFTSDGVTYIRCFMPSALT